MDNVITISVQVGPVSRLAILAGRLVEDTLVRLARHALPTTTQFFLDDLMAATTTTRHSTPIIIIHGKNKKKKRNFY